MLCAAECIQSSLVHIKRAGLKKRSLERARNQLTQRQLNMHSQYFLIIWRAVTNNDFFHFRGNKHRKKLVLFYYFFFKDAGGSLLRCKRDKKEGKYVSGHATD